MHLSLLHTVSSTLYTGKKSFGLKALPVFEEVNHFQVHGEYFQKDFTKGFNDNTVSLTHPPSWNLVLNSNSMPSLDS